MSKKKAKITEYNEKVQPKSEKVTLSILIALFFSFNLFFFGPYDFFLSNIKSIILSNQLLLWALIPTSAAAAAVIFLICFLTKGKAHIVTCCLISGIGLALYVQGNYLSISLGKLDGSDMTVSVPKGVLNLLLWAVIISIPFLVFKFNKPKFKDIVGFITAAVLMIEIITVVVSLIRISFFDNEAILYDTMKAKILSNDSEFVFSKEKNYLIILTDEYDSTCFDSAAETDPGSVEEFDGFTYYSNTLGMYKYTKNAVPCLLTGEAAQTPTYEGKDQLFKAIQKEYCMNLYTVKSMFNNHILDEYAENYLVKETDFHTVMSIGKIFYRVTFLKYFPEIYRSAFYTYTDDFDYAFSDMQSYSANNMDFYNSLDSTVELTDDPQFKFIYLMGLHHRRNITADLNIIEDGEISGDEAAIAMNKILSRYFRLLKDNGVYDNTEIVLMADHGLKEHDDGKYPLLMIKRAGADFEGIQTSYAPISHLDVYPTLMKIAGEDTGRETVFDIDENADRKRYFAQTDSYIEGNVKE